MKCKDCQFWIKRTCVDGSQEMICGLILQRRDSVDGCKDGQARQVEEYEDRALNGFDDCERLVKV
jgi:hypothetical protein